MSTALTNVQKYNGSAWQAVTALPAGRSEGSASNYAYGGFILQVGGRDAGQTVIATCQKFDGGTWTSTGSMSTARQLNGAAPLNSFFYVFGGLANDGTTEIGSGEKFNGATWASATSPEATNNSNGCAARSPVENVIYFMRGLVAGPSVTDVTIQYNTAESGSAIASSGNGRTNHGTGFIGTKTYKYVGSSDNTTTNGSAANKAWNSASWATDTSYPIATEWGAGAYSGLNIQYQGGYDTAGVGLTSSNSFNGTSWTAQGAMLTNVPRPNGCGSR